MNTLAYVGFFLMVFSLIYLTWQIVASIIDHFKKRSNKNRFVQMGIDFFVVIASFFMISTYKDTKADIQTEKQESSLSISKVKSEKAAASLSKSKAKSKSIDSSKAKSNSESIKASKKHASIATSRSESKKKESVAESKKAVSKSKAASTSKMKESESKSKSSSLAEAQSKSEASSTAKKKIKKQSKQAKYDKKAKDIYEDIGGDEAYPLTGHIEVSLNSSKKVNSVMVYADKSLARGTIEDLRHYFSAGVQIGNHLLDNDKDGEYNVPFIEVFAGNRMVARSQYSNNAQMKVLY